MSRHFFDIIRDLNPMQINFGFDLHVTHVSGDRVISQGTEMLSRGELNKVPCMGIPVREFSSLYLDDFQRNPCIKDWICSWI